MECGLSDATSVRLVPLPNDRSARQWHQSLGSRGEFLGDSELLVHSPSETASRRFLVALPLDPRDDWWAAGGSAMAVFDTYLANQGEKFWERPGW